ncbi:hypothetical protein BHE74_00005526 [Ensete ventricosum]|nr:hypothetical protein BHE74_00005526 [Ensete ventricosum]
MNSSKACAPYLAIVVVQLAYAGSNILCKLALEQGLSFLVFVVYRHLIALLILAPLAYVLERFKHQPALVSEVLNLHQTETIEHISQAIICEVYPARLSLNTMICFFASLQSSAVALVFERNAASWRLGWNLQLLTIIYCVCSPICPAQRVVSFSNLLPLNSVQGTVISCLTYYLLTYCIGEKGPVFAATFIPLQLVIVGFLSAFIFAERLHIGR